MRRFAVLGAVLALAGVATACGSSGDKDPTPVQTFKVTPASGATKPPASPTARATAATTAAATSAATAAASPTTTSGGATLTLVAKNILFDKATLTASAGDVTINVDNQDGGIPHNVHVFKGDSASGSSVGATPINTGPVKDTLKLRLDAGSYFYQCDVHPTTMSGKLTVS